MFYRTSEDHMCILPGAILNCEEQVDFLHAEVPWVSKFPPTFGEGIF